MDLDIYHERTPLRDGLSALSPTARVRHYEGVRKLVADLIDENGTGIDLGIQTAVTGLIAHGFNTVGSCEGHAGGPFPFPWILIEDPAAGKSAIHRREAPPVELGRRQERGFAIGVCAPTAATLPSATRRRAFRRFASPGY